jgi:3-phenylpropionate/trans-cinnamate dioxygenase ferredoxin reductase component
VSEQMSIVSGKQAAASAPQTLRAKVWQDQMTTVCKEDHLSRERPPLSNTALPNGRKTQGSLVHQPAFYVERGINLDLATKGLRIDRLAHRVGLSTDEDLPDDLLLMAIVAKPLSLPVWGGEHSGRTVEMLSHLWEPRAPRGLRSTTPRISSDLLIETQQSPLSI